MENQENYTSFVYLRDVVIREFGAKGLTKAILYSIIEGYYGSPEGCWITDEQLSKRLKISPRAIQKHLKHLDDKGYIRRITKTDVDKGIKTRKMIIKRYIGGTKN